MDLEPSDSTSSALSLPEGAQPSEKPTGPSQSEGALETSENIHPWLQLVPDCLCILLYPPLLGVTYWGFMHVAFGTPTQALMLVPPVWPLLMLLYRPRLVDLILYPEVGYVSRAESGWVAAWPHVTNESRPRAALLVRGYLRWTMVWLLAILTPLQVQLTGLGQGPLVERIWLVILLLLIAHVIYRHFFMIWAKRVL